MEVETPATISFQLEPTGVSPQLDPGGFASAEAFSVAVPSLDAGVDLCAVGRALGVEPFTVRLNGHLISGGANGVSSVTWNSLLSFFSSRGFPTGLSRDGGHPIRVQGRHLATGSLYEKKRGAIRPGEVGLCFKRDSPTLDDETPLKKKKSIHCTPNHLENVFCPAVDENSLLCLKRKLTLDDDTPLKKRRSSENSRFIQTSCHCTHQNPLQSGLNGSFIGRCQKFRRENGMLINIPCTQTE